MDDKKKQAPTGWLEALAISEAELAAGLTVPLEKVLQEFDEDGRKFEAAPKRLQPRHRVAHRR
jgi:hypothetical protein